MRSHILQATGCCFAFLLSFILGVSGQTGVTTSIPSSLIPSSLSTLSPQLSVGGSSMSSTTSGVSLGVTGSPTGTADFPTLSGYSECGTHIP